MHRMGSNKPPRLQDTTSITDQRTKKQTQKDTSSFISPAQDLALSQHDDAQSQTADEDALLRNINNLMSGATHTSECMYQFTLDRIDNNLPHNRDNVLICCQYCNCFGESDKRREVEHQVCKICPNKCHTIKRNIPRTRQDVSKIEIQILLLK